MSACTCAQPRPAQSRQRVLCALLAAVMLFTAWAHDISVLLQLDGHAPAHAVHEHAAAVAHDHAHEDAHDAPPQGHDHRGAHCAVCLVALQLPFVAAAHLEWLPLPSIAIASLQFGIGLLLVDAVFGWCRKRKRGPPGVFPPAC